MKPPQNKKIKPRIIQTESLVKSKLRVWEQRALKDSISRLPERKTTFSTNSGIPIKRLYTPVDWQGKFYLRDLGFPGEAPFTRGVQPTMYRSRLWTMRQYSGFGSAHETNLRYRYLLKHGQTGLSIAFDLPTQLGYDSDHPLSEGEVGKVGVPISTLEDAEVLFRGIPLDKVSTSMTINATAAVMLGMYIAVAQRNNLKVESLQGTLQNDILKEYVARGTYIYPPRESMRLTTDIISFCRRHLPRFNPISISGYHIREAGATAIQEVAFTFANAIAYVEAATSRGMSVDAIAPRISFFFNAHNNFLEEIAKFRAARRLWANIMSNHFKAKDPRSHILRFHAQTAGSTLTAQQPENNIVRVTIQAIAAVMGGAQSLHTNSFDEALALPTEDSARIALRTQQIIACESGIADTIDPLGGAYSIETLTNEIEKGATDYLKKIADLGGAVRAIERGFMQSEIADSAYRHQLDVESGGRIVVGVNHFNEPAPPLKSLLKMERHLERQQIRKLKAFRNKRKPATIRASLEKVKNAAIGTDNIIPPIIDAVKSGATLGEITSALRTILGEHSET